MHSYLNSLYWLYYFFSNLLTLNGVPINKVLFLYYPFYYPLNSITSNLYISQKLLRLVFCLIEAFEYSKF